jgi:CBS domain-containing protein
MKVRDVMTKSVESVTPDSDLVLVARQMKSLNVGSMPVVEGDRLLGIITDRDIVTRVVAEGKNPQSELVRDYLTPNPTTISADADAKEASAVMAREQIRRLPVVEGDTLVGFLSIGDLAADTGQDKLVGDTLEKISEPAEPRTSEAGR